MTCYTKRHPKLCDPAVWLAVLLAIGFVGCAVPVPPSGGPSDTEPPVIESSEPADFEVSVRTSRLTIVFSEYINEGSFRQAFSISPELDQLPQISWKKRRVTIDLQSELRDNTTYIVTIDKSLRDARGVSVQRPLTFAFSTGPTINRASLRGRVVSAARGRPVGGLDVFAYQRSDTAAAPEVRPKPDFRTQSGDDGRWVLNYLTPAEYFVIAVDDQNRNKVPDDGEAIAVPSRPDVTADTTRAEARAQWILSRTDTLRPALRTSRGVSTQRYELRFSEPVTASRPELWAIADSISGDTTRALVYRTKAEPASLWVLSDMAGRTGYLVGASVSDSSANVTHIDPLLLQPGSAPDTTVPRFVEFHPRADGRIADLLPWQDPAVRFSSGIADSLASKVITVRDTLGNPVSFSLSSNDGTLFAVRPVDGVIHPDPLSVSVAGGSGQPTDSAQQQIFRRLPSSRLGGISGLVVADTMLTSTRVDVYDVKDLLKPVSSSQPDTDGRFAFPLLPDGVYSVRAFIDSNDNGLWDGGLAVPYTPPETISWARDTVRVRPRWDTVLQDTLKLTPQH